MTEKTLTTENIKPALDALRGELAPWPVVAKKQDRLNAAQLNAANSGITSSLVAQIIANTAAIRALESAITGTGLRALVVSSLPATGTQGILYIVPVTTYDPDTDADVVNYSNEYIWIPVEGGTASEGHYEQVGQTGIVINNGQLTITVNGTSVGTFTANQSGDTTAAITVPTNADYVDRTTDQTVAGIKTFSSTINGTASKAIADEDGTSIKTGYVNVAGNQTVTGQKTWSGENTYTNSILTLKQTGLETGVIPASNQTRRYRFTDKNNVDLGWVQHRVNTSGESYIELYAVNKFDNSQLSPQGAATASSFAIGLKGDGTRFANIMSNLYPASTNTYALGSSSYQWSSVYAQTYYYNGTAWGLDKANVWTGANSFTSVIQQRINSVYSQIPTTDRFAVHEFVGTDSNRIFTVNCADRSSGQREMSLIVYDTDGTFQASGLFKESDNSFSFRARSNKEINLGTSTNKWKTLNGVNPGALSLPKTDGFVDITSSITSIAGGVNRYTPTVNGWVSIAIKGGANNSVFLFDSVSYLSQGCYGSNIDTIDGRVAAYIPVIANQMIYIIVRCAQGEIYSARFFPCLGNV